MHIHIILYICIYNRIFKLSPVKLSGRNDVSSDKVNFRTNIKQNFYF